MRGPIHYVSHTLEVSPEEAISATTDIEDIGRAKRLQTVIASVGFAVAGIFGVYSAQDGIVETSPNFSINIAGIIDVGVVAVAAWGGIEALQLRRITVQREREIQHTSSE
jgi:hypothetical protein